MDIKFKPFSEFPSGIMVKLLKDAYSFDARYERDWEADWKQADEFFYTHLDIADQCGFITTLQDIPIGFICWDPRNLSEYIEIGHNCITTAYKGNGYGKLQLQEAIKRIRTNTLHKIIVTTDEQLIPAQKNYESVGFKFLQKRENTVNPEYAGKLIDYTILVDQDTIECKRTKEFTKEQISRKP